MEDIKQVIGQRIKAARIKKGLTQKEFGEKLGLTRSVIGGYELGKQNLTVDTLKKIADALGVDLNINLG
ncbi:helix-turn-helix domain-containing protein [Fibrella forsythiae]|uniref:Helix-turn-helix transcriptional regulator n=1 Tax=Fibrella forsythiae TaxID=2817061 RepID=A0ABS3JBY9_9BACT|nr:helix-turn-helix transcriptional regulator [Fibrella forsythiae]MBO0947516.1 helix-turn-helix transcriptional regulator [Fibrella forsythiae]